MGSPLLNVSADVLVGYFKQVHAVLVELPYRYPLDAALVGLSLAAIEGCVKVRLVKEVVARWYCKYESPKLRFSEFPVPSIISNWDDQQNFGVVIQMQGIFKNLGKLLCSLVGRVTDNSIFSNEKDL